MPKKKTPARKRKPAKPDLSHIAAGLRDLAQPIESLTLDPKNTRKHDAKNLQAIAAMLRQFGQRAPVVIRRENRVVTAGNGRVEAARKILGWTHVAVLEMDDDEAQAVAYAIGDNRTSELAQWDYDLLADQLPTVDAESPELFGDLLLDSFLAKPAEEEPPEDPPGPPKSAFQVIVECQSASERKKLVAKLRREGLQCHEVTWK